MYQNDLKINIPNELLEEMEIQGTIISPVFPEMGILVLSDGMFQFSKEIVIRIYRLELEADTQSYKIYYELVALSFSSYSDAKDFVDHLPNMSGIEMLILLNPEPKFQ
ncbi:hypothetical protein [Ferdinandcohnia sp. SAFN-114]|uniref:hypothetical protein n=1 Tax=Ferdinandcohnia sp. SAFN-114 TaxID=3387275 RepID=UPI003F7ED2FD